ncbi:unnamed protein product [Danaus chrysippus]|uniref:(African queen) hypothetical protein n=1 Tax=Danaus chrysippus TaxID=151541 RepID=A0A8J2VVC8_9NEOP|nr:unnamed protein product [Danaus chrysippus]
MLRASQSRREARPPWPLLKPPGRPTSPASPARSTGIRAGYTISIFEAFGWTGRGEGAGRPDPEGRGAQDPSRRRVSRFAMSRRCRSECIRGRKVAT